MKKTVSVLGCGWLGLPLALELADRGYVVKGSSTSEMKLPVLKDLGIKPYLIKLNPIADERELLPFLDSGILIINIPPAIARQGEDFHIKQMEFLQNFISGSAIKKIIYISSTSVYPDNNSEAKEEDVMMLQESANKTLFQAEAIVRNIPGVDFLILRCGGLAGYDRNLVKHFAGKTNLSMGNAPVNLVHRDDVISIIFEFLEKDIWNDIFNVCAPIHPLRKDFYPELARRYNYAIPHYDENDNSSYKIISAEKLNNVLQYKFKFPDPLLFFYNS